MKKISLYVLLVVSIFLNSNCNEAPKEKDVVVENTMTDSTHSSSAATNIDNHNSANSLDWNGTYKGILPCADCEGIATEIRLGKDSTYTIKTSYVGKTAKAREEKGTFSWNAEGNTILLTGITKRPNQYFVGENYLAQMDMDGKRITGDLAGKYLLTKQQQVAASKMADSSYKNATLLETYWKLITLNGKVIDTPAEGKKEIYLILKQKDHRLQGFSGCNTMMGSFELKERNFISFKNVAGTRMACPDMKDEDAFKKMLEQADNYSISGDNLSINKAKMSALATFKAVYLK